MYLIEFPCCAFLPVFEDVCISEFGERDTAVSTFHFFYSCWRGWTGWKKDWSGPRGVLDYQADFHGQFSTQCVFCSPFMRAEGFLDAFRCWNQTAVLVPVCLTVILIEGWGSDRPNRPASVCWCTSLGALACLFAWLFLFCVNACVCVLHLMPDTKTARTDLGVHVALRLFPWACLAVSYS